MRTSRMAVPLLGALLTIGSLTAQSTFEVASIKPNTSGETGGQMGGDPTTGRVTVTNYTLLNIIRNAYNVQPYQIVRGSARVPDWIDRERWDILAKGPHVANPQQMEAMVQALLADRFKLVVRRETRDEPAYALVVTRPDRRLGPQMTPATGPCAEIAAALEAGKPLPDPLPKIRCGTSATFGSVTTHGVRMSDFARNLGPMTGRPVVDKTGLAGSFDLQLRWTPDQVPAGVQIAPSGDAPSLFAAVQEQLGLKLEPTKTPIDMVVIESVERPAPD